MTSDLLEQVQQQLVESFAEYKRKVATKCMDSAFPNGWPEDFKKECKWVTKGGTALFFYKDICMAAIKVPAN